LVAITLIFIIFTISDFFNLADLQDLVIYECKLQVATYTHKSLNLVTMGFSFGCQGHSSGERKSQISCCCSSTVLHAQCTTILSCWSWYTKLPSTTCL